MTSKIVWRQIPGASDYQVSSGGQVMSYRRGRMRILNPHKHGRWWKVGYYPDGKTLPNGFVTEPEAVRRSVAEIVLETFVGPSPGPTFEPYFLDGDIGNLAASNLVWHDISNLQRMKPTVKGRVDRDASGKEVRLRAPTHHDRWTGVSLPGLMGEYRVSSHGHVQKYDPQVGEWRMCKIFIPWDGGAACIRVQNPMFPSNPGLGIMLPVQQLVACAWHGLPPPGGTLARYNPDPRDLSAANFFWRDPSEPDAPTPTTAPLVSPPHNPAPHPGSPSTDAATRVPSTDAATRAPSTDGAAKAADDGAASTDGAAKAADDGAAKAADAGEQRSSPTLVVTAADEDDEDGDIIWPWA